MNLCAVNINNPALYFFSSPRFFLRHLTLPQTLFIASIESRRKCFFFSVVQTDRQLKSQLTAYEAPSRHAWTTSGNLGWDNFSPMFPKVLILWSKLVQSSPNLDNFSKLWTTLLLSKLPAICKNLRLPAKLSKIPWECGKIWQGSVVQSFWKMWDHWKSCKLTDGATCYKKTGEQQVSFAPAGIRSRVQQMNEMWETL